MLSEGRYAALRGQYPHVYWIAGGSYSGKSSIADALGVAYDLQVVHTDGLMNMLWEKADPERHPVSARLLPVWRQGFVQWMQLPIDQLSQGSYERFELLLDEIETIRNQPTVVEGMGIHPFAVAEIADLEHVVCLTGSESFLREKEPEYPFVKHYYAQWDDPEHDLQILIEGHIRLSREYERGARELGIRHIEANVETGWDEVYAWCARILDCESAPMR
jgi:hypothetical protein